VKELDMAAIPMTREELREMVRDLQAQVFALSVEFHEHMEYEKLARQDLSWNGYED